MKIDQKRGWKWSNENYSSQSLGSFGRVVAFDTRDLQFNSSHRYDLSTINYIGKMKIHQKEAGNGLLKTIK